MNINVSNFLYYFIWKKKQFNFSFHRHSNAWPITRKGISININKKMYGDEVPSSIIYWTLNGWDQVPNIRFPLLGQVMLGIMKLNLTPCGPTKLSVYYTRTYLIVSNQLQIQQPTLFLFASGFLKSLTLFRPGVFRDPPNGFCPWLLECLR